MLATSAFELAYGMAPRPWVDGTREDFGPLVADRVHELRRGTGRPAD